MLFLKEHKHIALHVACGDITDAELIGDKLRVNVNDGTLVNLLNDGKRDIESALRWQGLDMKLEVFIKESESSVAEKDIKRLKEIFDKIIIKEFKK